MAAGKNNIIVFIAAQDNSEVVLKQLMAHLETVKNTANDAGDAVLRIGGKAVGVAALAAIAARAVGALGSVVTSALNLGTEMENMSKKTGLSVSTLSTLSYASKLTGNDFELVTRAVSRLDKTIGDAAGGNKQAQAVMASLGLNAKDLAGNTNGAGIAFQVLGKALQNTSGPNRQTLAMHAMGRGGADLIPILLQVGANMDYMKERAEAAGMQLDNTTAEQLARSNRALADMKLKVEGAGVAFTRGLTPGIDSFLNVISNGKGSMDAFVTFGHAIGRAMSVAEAAAYGLASGIASIAAAGSSIGEDHMDKGLLDAAAEYDKKAREAAYFAIHGQEEHPAPESPLDKTTTADGKPHGGIIDSSGADRIAAAKKQRDASLAKLAEESAQLRYERVKSETEQQLALVEENHKQELLSDEEFYSQKLALQRKAIDAELEAAREKQAAIDTNIASLQKDARKHGGRLTVDVASGSVTAAKGHDGDATAIEDQAKIADLLAKRLQLTGQIATIAGKTGELELQYATDLYELKKKELALADDLAAKRETSAGGNVSARLKQSADKYTDEKQPLDLRLSAAQVEGNLAAAFSVLNDLANLAANFKTEQDSIRVTGAEETYSGKNSAITAQRTAITDDVARGTLSHEAGEKSKDDLGLQQAQALEPVLEAYKQLAADGNLQASEKVAELSVQIAELKNPIDDVAARMREQFDGAFQGLFENLDKGKKGWADFGRQIQGIFIQQAYKRLIEPGVQAGLGQVFRNGGDGIPFHGESASPIGSALSKVLPGLGKLAGFNPKEGGKAGATPVSIQLVNQSGHPLGMEGGGQSGDLIHFLTDPVKHIILSDLDSNGSLAKAFGGVASGFLG